MVLVLVIKNVVVVFLLIIFVLIAPSERKIKAPLHHVFYWVNKNEMSFGINKCATTVIKPLNFVSYPGYEENMFYFGIYSIPKESMYIYLKYPLQ